jgi:TetR/AcrR family transcriptional regulator, upper aerobic nicotinate degradation pathway regulator
MNKEVELASGISVRESRATAEALIAAGRRLFARHGYDGTSVRAITAKAGANLGAITYHFGSKRALYERVVEDSLVPLAGRVEAAARGPGTPIERVEGVVRAYFGHHLVGDPDFLRLMLQELVLGRMPPQAAAESLWRIKAALTELVLEGQAEGMIRSGDPWIMALGIISHPVHFSLMAPVLRALTGLDLHEPSTRERVVEQALGFVLEGIACESEEPHE